MSNSSNGFREEQQIGESIGSNTSVQADTSHGVASPTEFTYCSGITELLDTLAEYRDADGNDSAWDNIITASYTSPAYQLNPSEWITRAGFAVSKSRPRCFWALTQSRDTTDQVGAESDPLETHQLSLARYIQAEGEDESEPSGWEIVHDKERLRLGPFTVEELEMYAKELRLDAGEKVEASERCVDWGRLLEVTALAGPTVGKDLGEVSNLVPVRVPPLEQDAGDYESDTSNCSAEWSRILGI
jgi:hypothetical protein